MLRISLISLFFATGAFAHEPGLGPNGGMRVDAGPYRVELVLNGTRVDAHVTMDDDSAVATETMTGTAILVLDGKPVRIPLEPTAAGVLSGDTGSAVPETVKGAVQLTDADGKTVQAKF
ncbi:hypothetical protein [Paracoccus benzoatiresistens]|uniref:Uncharacterized protein n=1 Tax=Paracoccus benzoatiresistens TaxID=2997341 RepID=A0ABT4JBF9_9RHOB|nr:hypothetical protein [Paracoccus sp. EF6]MCZ0963806.1 hypothetical protein [Paracoccus sp. EF6]